VEEEISMVLNLNVVVTLQVVDWLRVVAVVAEVLRGVVIVVVLRMVDLEWSSLGSNVVRWFNEVGSVGVEAVAVIGMVIVMALMIILIVVGGYDWLVMVVGVWVAPVDIASVPGVVRVLSNWLLNVESLVVVVVCSMSNLLVWDLVDLNSGVISMTVVIVIPLMMILVVS
jgi:hypothetical protein